MHRPCINFVTRPPVRRLTGLLACALLALAALVADGRAFGAGSKAIEALIERGQHAMRVDPDASRRDAESDPRE